MTAHGQLPVPREIPDGLDSDLLMIFADLSTWSAAHPCECEGMCECDSSPLAYEGNARSA